MHRAERGEQPIGGGQGPDRGDESVDSRVEAAAATGLTADEVHGWLARMSTGGDLGPLQDSSAADLCDVLQALELLKNAAAAAQARVSVIAAEQLRRDALDAGESPSNARKGIAAQLAMARRESPHAGSRHLGMAVAVVTEMPCLHAAMSAGVVPEWTATKVVQATACLTREQRAEVDAHLAGRLGQVSDRALVAAAAAKSYELDPYAATNRGRRAAADRRISIRPAPDVMSCVSGFLPVAQGVACFKALDEAAKALKSAGDPRSMDQLRADLFTARLTGREPADGMPVEVGLVMTDRALLGLSDEAGSVEGYGPVPAPYARDLAAGRGLDSDGHPEGEGDPHGDGDPQGEGVPHGDVETECDVSRESGDSAGRREALIWLRRLYADPETGVLTARDPRRRRFRGALRRFLVARDQVCRTPWCNAPIRHADHVRPWAAGGETTAEGGAGLCEACNYAKESRGWTHEPVTLPDGSTTIKITTPTGHTYYSEPPPVLPALSPDDGGATIRSAPPEQGLAADAGSALSCAHPSEPAFTIRLKPEVLSSRCGLVAKPTARRRQPHRSRRAAGTTANARREPG